MNCFYKKQILLLKNLEMVSILILNLKIIGDDYYGKKIFKRCENR